MGWIQAIPAIASAAASVYGAIKSSKAGGQQAGGQEDAINALMKMFEEAKGFEMPFMQAGQFAIPGLEQLSGKLSDPTAEVNKILGQFQQSPAQKFVQQQATSGVQNQAEQLGLLDSGSERTALAKTISGLAGQNQQQYLQNVTGEQARNAQILETLFGTGASAAGNLSRGALGAGEDIAKFKAGVGSAQAAGSLGLGGIFGSLGSMFGQGGSLSNLFGGGSQGGQGSSQDPLQGIRT